MLKLLKVSASHEDLFVERYDRLLGWALQLAEHDRDLAEDMVHDAFVHFAAITRPDLSAIQNLDAYFYASLRNLHISQQRRASRVRFQQLSIVEYESAATGLRTLDQRDAITLQDELRRVCQYACARKQTAKIASVLILRFFHGYYPSEIARVLRSARPAVDKALQLARGEAKIALTDPKALGFRDSIPQVDLMPARMARPAADLLSELQAMIFAARHGECPSRSEHKEFYGALEATPMDCERLAHVVSCVKCLDQINTMLKLPSLAERNPADSSGKDSSGPGGSGTAGSGAGGPSPKSRIRKGRDRAREAFEHRPQELCVSVNGYIQGAQKVASEVSELDLSANLAEDVNFVEVFSEQGIRLLLLNAGEPPPHGADVQKSRAELSDGRTLELTLQFRSSWPNLHLVYSDPNFKAVEELDANALEHSENRRSQIRGQRSVEARDGNLSLFGSELITERESLSNGFAGIVSRLRSGVFGSGFFLRPGVVTALLGLIAMAVVISLHVRRAPLSTVSSATLFAQSIAAENAVAARADQVVHRTINVEESVVATGRVPQLLSHRKIDLWQSGAQALAALRVYDQQSQLVNGQWSRAGSSRVLLHHGAKLQPAPGRQISESSIRFEDIWQVVPSAKVFASLLEHDDKASVTETQTEYTINYQRDVDVDGLQRATLVLNRPELRAVRQTLWIKQGNEVREYSFSESSFEVRPVGAVAPSVFEPDAELLSSAKPETGNPKPETYTSTLPLASIPAAATANLELEVVRQLNQVNAFLGEQINVERTSEGLLNVKGIVETDERKSELLQALSSFRSDPAVKIDITTVAEVLKRQRQSSSGLVTTSEVASGKGETPVEADLRQYLSKRGVPTEQLNQEIQRFSSRVLNHSFQARRHALALKQIAERFSLEDLRSLDPPAMGKWQAMISQHARALQQETSSLRRELEQAFPALAAGNEGGIDVASDEAIVRAAQRLFAVAVDNDERVRHSFAVYAGGAGLAPIKTAQFWQSLGNAERIAQAIQNRQP
jgi:RNA polymerase sigma factor (sigma-70 family)